MKTSLKTTSLISAIIASATILWGIVYNIFSTYFYLADIDRNILYDGMIASYATWWLLLISVAAFFVSVYRHPEQIPIRNKSFKALMTSGIIAAIILVLAAIWWMIDEKFIHTMDSWGLENITQYMTRLLLFMGNELIFIPALLYAGICWYFYAFAGPKETSSARLSSWELTIVLVSSFVAIILIHISFEFERCCILIQSVAVLFQMIVLYRLNAENH